MNRAQGFLAAFHQNFRKVMGSLKDKVTHFEWDREVAPGITAIGAPGHTPGHTVFTVASGGRRVLVQGDLTNIPELFVRNPDWHVMFDLDPAQAVASRRRIYDLAVTERTPIVGFHFAFPALGHAEKDGNGYRIAPLPWNPAL